MGILNNYKDYKQFWPDYSNWTNEQDLENAKRSKYLQNNPQKINQKDIERGKNLLHAIDVMDEYSQSNAEDTEVATQMVMGQVVGLTTFLGTLLGGMSAFLKPVQKVITKIAKNNPAAELIANMAPTVIGMLIGTAASFPVIAWSTKAKIGASRRGRFDAMNNELKNPAMFAVLTPEQQKKVEELSKDVELEDRDKKRLEKTRGKNMNPLESFRTLKKMFKNQDEYKQKKLEFDTKLKEDESKFDTPLSEKQIQDAKRDQQILANMVRKIDIASQDYAENAELATNTITTLALGTGGLVGWVSNKILNVLKTNNKVISKFVPWAIGLTIPLAMSIYSAKIQKQASRIARHKVKQELINNPTELVYVDKEETKNMTDVKAPEKNKKPNIFKFFIQLVKDNKEYQNYIKTKGVEQLKQHKVLDQIELSEEQIKDAKNLQKNVFKTFNKVDEKSQSYSESVEAMGQVAQQGASLIGSLAATGISISKAAKMLLENDQTVKSFTGVLGKIMPTFALCLLPVIVLDILTTKAQKKASRVADMLALKELEDYRHYADYSEEKIEKNNTIEQNETNLLKRFQS